MRNFSSPLNRLCAAYFLALIIVAMDQASKAWVFYDLMNPPKTLPLLPFLDIVLTWNRGVGFGLLQAESTTGVILLITLALSISIALGVWLWRSTNFWLFTGLSFIIGGAIGNIIDRLRFGAVLDFIYVHVYIFGYHFPAFNIADSAITVGAGLLLVESYLGKKDDSFTSAHKY